VKIRSDVLRTYQVLHSWTGIVSGLLLFIGFFAGALILFQDSITDWATPKLEYQSQTQSQAHDFLLQQVFSQYPETLKAVTVNFEQGKAPVTWNSKPSRELHLVSQQQHAMLAKNQQLHVFSSQPNLLATLIDQLHRTGGLIGELEHEHWGAYVLGIASILYFLALVSGLIFLLPTLVKSLFALRTHKTSARFWLDTHNLFGITSFPFHLVIALTVVVFVFHDFFYAGLNPIYGDKPMFSRPAKSATAFDARELPSLELLKQKAETQARGFTVSHISFTNLNSQAPMAMVGITSNTDVVRGPYYDYLYMHPYSLQSFDFGNAHTENGIWAKIVKVFFAVHFGSFGGDSGRWLYFFLGLGGAVLFYTGNLLWLEKKFDKNKSHQSKSVKILAKLTVAVPLGSMLGVAVCFALTKVLMLSEVAINLAYLWLYYFSFTLALLYSFRVGHVRAASNLCYCLVVSLLAIPAISLLLHLTGQWQTLLNHWGIDIAAALLALMFWKMARKTQYRSQYGEVESLWSTVKT